jgi:hypothetical protein
VDAVVSATIKTRKNKASVPEAGAPPPPTKRDVFLDLTKATAEFSAVRSRESLEYEERKVLLAEVLKSLVDVRQAVLPGTGRIRQLYLQVHDLFDVKGMFYDTDVSEWGALLGPSANSGKYALHSEQKKAAPLGSSLGWVHQIDGDERRDQFLNAPWAWVCIPVKPGKESQAAEFLKAQGLLISRDNALDKILREMGRFREAETIVSKTAVRQEDVKVKRGQEVEDDPRPWLSTAEPLKELKLTWNDVYPLISTQFTMQYVQGFIFDTIGTGPNWSDSAASMQMSVEQTPSLHKK